MNARIIALLVLVSLGAGCSSPSSTPDRPESVVGEPAPVRPVPHPVATDPWTVIGRSVEQRPIRARTVGRGPYRVYVIGSIHGNETEGLGAVPALVDSARSSPVSSMATVRIVEDMNPDGSASGSRNNANGVDLNRNWPAKNFRAYATHGTAPLSEPEARCVHDDIERFDPDLIIVLHSTTRGPFVNHDGPAIEQAAAFATGASRADPRWRLVPDMGYPTPGSLGSFVGVDRRAPILTVEFDRPTRADAAERSLVEGFRSTIGASFAK